MVQLIRRYGLWAAIVGAFLVACSEAPQLTVSKAEAPEAAEVEDDLFEFEKPQPPPAPDGSKNTPPEITWIGFQPDEPTSTHGALQVVFETRDADDDSLFFHYEWTVDGEPAGNGSNTLSLANVKRGQDIEVTVIANDGKDPSRPAVASVDLRNSPPEIARIATESERIQSGSEVVAVVETEDPDGDDVSLSYVWKVNDGAVQASGRSLSTERIKRGSTIEVTVTPFDGQLRGEPKTSPVWVVGNAPPQISSKPDPESPDGEFRYLVEVTDADRDDRSIAVGLEDAPAGMVIDTDTNTIHWSPTAEQAGTHTFIVVADDRKGGVTRQQIEVTVGTGEETPGEETPAAIEQ